METPDSLNTTHPGTDPGLINLPQRMLASFFMRLRLPVFAGLLISAILLLLSAYLAAKSEIKLIYPGIVFFIGNIVLQSTAYLTIVNGKQHLAGRNMVKIIRYTAYTCFFSACGVAGYLESGSSSYLTAVCFMGFLWAYLTLLMSGFVSPAISQIEHLVSAENLKQVRDQTPYFWEKSIHYLAPLVRLERVPLLVLLATLIDMPGILFWGSAILLSGSLIILLRLLTHQNTDDARVLRQSVLAFIFYLAGATLLLLLVLRLPFSDLMEAVNLVGPEVIWLAILPFVWAVPHAMTLTVLLDNRISLRDALYTQISGDGFNGITPLLGMGGEPYKARHLSRFVPLADSSRAIVQSRLIHALSGVLFTFIILAICLVIIDFSDLPGLKLAIWAVTIAMAIISVLLIWLTMSRAPSHATDYILSKFKLIEEFRHDPLTWPKLCMATVYRLAARGGRFLELYLIFLFLGIVPNFADVILVQGMVLASVSVFFFVPQGLGVNELGIATALDIAGYSAATGVVFGLIRRARMVIYSLLGLIVYAIGTFLYSR